LPAVKAGTLRAAMMSFSPVFGLRPFALLAIANDEAAERNQLHFIALDQCVSDFVQHEIDDFADLALRELRLFRQGVD
jgi:hypothetical protein